LLERALKRVEAMRLPPNAKEMVFRGKNLVLLGDAERGCALFDEAKTRYPDSPFALNNAAICDLRAPEKRDAQRAALEDALARASRDEHRDNIRANLAGYDAWRAAGYQGRYDGALIY